MRLFHLQSCLITILAIFVISCSNSTNSINDELINGQFLAEVENGDNFKGDATFEIEIPTYGYQNVLEDSVLFLVLKTGEITNTREINGEITEYTINIGLTLNSLWKADTHQLELGSTFFQNLFIQPNTLESHGIRSGSINIEEKNAELLVGTFELLFVNNSNVESTINGEFRAIRKE